MKVIFKPHIFVHVLYLPTLSNIAPQYSTFSLFILALYMLCVLILLYPRYIHKNNNRKHSLAQELLIKHLRNMLFYAVEIVCENKQKG